MSLDLMFKYILGSSKNIRFTEDLLESFYDLKPGTLKDITISNSVKLDRNTILNKKFEVDVEIKLQNGDYINLECYRLFDENASIKSVMYIASSFSLSLRAGEDYDKTKRHTQINFVKNNTIQDSTNLINKFLLINQSNTKDIMIPELLQIFVINLDLKDDMKYNGVNERLVRWLKLLNVEELEEIEAIGKEDSLMSEVVEEMRMFSGNKEVQDYRAQEALIRSQHKRALKEENLKGKKLGEEIGQEEAVLKIAKNMLRHGDDISYVSTITGLREEELSLIKESLEEA